MGRMFYINMITSTQGATLYTYEGETVNFVYFGFDFTFSLVTSLVLVLELSLHTSTG